MEETTKIDVKNVDIRNNEPKIKLKHKFFKSNTFYFLMFAAVSIVGYCIFYAYPVVRTIILSFTDKTATSITYEFVGFENYIKVFLYETSFLKSLGNSFIFAFFSGVLVLTLAMLAALLLNGKFPGMGIFRVILFLPFIIPAFASVSIFKGLFDPNSGIINNILFNMGIQGPGWFKSENTAMFTMILMSAWGFGIQMLIFLSALQSVPHEIYDAAEIDGVNAIKKFIYVTIPMISPMLFLNVILATINGLKNFNTGYLVGGASGEPNGATLLFPVLIYREAFTGSLQRLGYASALAFVYFFIILAVTIVQFILKKLYVHDNLSL